MRSFKDQLYWQFLHLMPKNAISRVAGFLASSKLPQPLMRWVITAFARHFQINMAEIASPVDAFESLQAFFTRTLREGARPVDSADDAWVSPCDGAYGQSGQVQKGLLLQVKGRHYRLSELLCDDKWAERLEGGTFATLYLSPKDYHRFHAPCDFEVMSAAHVPGHLWPVNRWAVQHIDELFCINERVVMKAVMPEYPDTPFAFIAVGATMVGKVKLNFDDALTTNRPNGRYFTKRYPAKQASFKKGDEVGRFEFGSTLIVVVPKELGALDERATDTLVKMGQKIGTK